VSDVFVHNRVTGRTRLFSKSSTGRQSTEMSFGGSISDDGKRVAFSSLGAGLVVRDTNGTWDVFVRDRVRQRTRRVSVGPNRREAIGNREPFYSAWISSDGSAVAFESLAGNLIGRDTNGRADIFVHGRPAACAPAAA
jgi:hypothetical protein